ncbi:MAG: phosphopantothenate/pantothenate synthetase [Thermoplasmata archaeon]|jgi:4-phosphopantoate--beta-alanine ligase
MRLSPRHPRYASLTVRHALAEAHRQGLVVPEGLIAQGRGEAFDYLLGERTTPGARRAERAAAEWLLAARHPVVSVNGNVAALAANEVAALSRAVPGLDVEVNLFHRTGSRARQVAEALRAAGVRRVLGLRPTATIPHLPSDRAKVDRRGIRDADVCLVPLEDGDRTEALRALGKRVISIDLNPLSRTSRAADLPIVDEVKRALAGVTREVERRRKSSRPPRFTPFDRRAALSDALEAIGRGIRRTAAQRPIGPRRGRASARRPRGSAGRTRRTP